MTHRTRMQVLATTFLGLLVSACTNPVVATDSSQHLSLSEVRVVDRGVDQDGAFCQDFSLDAVQVRRFFDAAVIVDADQWHHEYDYLPCYVRGTAIKGTTEVSWEIRAGGTATVKAPGEPILLLVCAKCAEDFR
jgi:hypothetical protein